MIRTSGPIVATGGAGAASGGGAKRGGATGRSGGAKMPALADFLAAADFTGAATLLEFQRRADEADENTVPWLAYCAFHLGDYARAMALYQEIADERKGTPAAWEALLNKALCLYHLGRYSDAEAVAGTCPDSPLKNRLLFHTAHKLGNEPGVRMAVARLSAKDKHDQLTLAAMQYMRNSHGEAVDIYKKLLYEYREDVALNVYIAMAYFKLDYYDVSSEVLQVYAHSRGSSLRVANLKACNQFRLLNGKAAEAEFKALADTGASVDGSDLIRHNLVVFRGGEAAPRVLTRLVGTIAPEARLNLVIHHLKNGALAEAFELMRDVAPTLPAEYILKAIVHALVGQALSTGGAAAAKALGHLGGSAVDHLRAAQRWYNTMGSSASECDTIPGRQCMACHYFLQRTFDHVNIYLSSIKPYLYADDDFNWNYGVSLAATGNYKEAEETFLLVQNPAYTSDPTYLQWLARCFIMNRKARAAWELYLKTTTSTVESVALLQVIANDAYKTGAFLYAAKAFDCLQRIPEVGADPEWWEGKRGACIGVFQQVIAGQEGKDALKDVLIMLRNTPNPQVEFIVRTITKWVQSAGGL